MCLVCSVLWDLVVWIVLLVRIIRLLYSCLIMLSWWEENRIDVFLVVLDCRILVIMFIVRGFRLENGLLRMSILGLCMSDVVICVCCWLLSESDLIVLFSCLFRLSLVSSVVVWFVVFVLLKLCRCVRYMICLSIFIFG